MLNRRSIHLYRYWNSAPNVSFLSKVKTGRLLLALLVLLLTLGFRTNRVLASTVELENFSSGSVQLDLEQSTDDVDGDGVVNEADNCPTDANPGQQDLDGDGYGNV
ncbi:MAG: thrombospondin type 3 repeat-containing protein, partial [Caldilineaceae bacterium]|nr:thrombospondin type 3 repeat-containing protein [Caldilineaceae bacterium]